MSRTIGDLLVPLRGEYTRFVAGMIVRQALLVGGGYAMVLGLRHWSPDVSVWWFVALLVAYDLGFMRLDFGLNLFFSERLSFPLFRKLRVAALAKAFRMPLQWHHARNSGKLVAEVNNGVGRTVQTAEAISRELLPAVIRTVLSLVPLLFLSPWTTPAILAALGVFLWLNWRENEVRQPLRAERHDAYAQDFAVFNECVQQVQPVVQFGQEQRLLDRYDRLQRDIERGGMHEQRLGAKLAVRRNMVLSGTKRICQGLWLQQYLSGKLDAGAVMYLNMLTEDLLNSFWAYAGLMERIFEGLEPGRSLFRLLGERAALDDATAAGEGDLGLGIDLADVHFSYDGQRTILNHFNLHVPAGQVVGFVGRSGSGKSTITSLLSRLYDVQSGAVLVGGRDVREWPLRSLRGSFSFVTQNGGVFLSGQTVLETIRFGRPDATIEECVEAAQAACIHDHILLLEHGYDTTLGSGVSLSKGQQQRIALAQALVALSPERRVLVLDEFTSALDVETEAQIMRNIQPWLAGRTVLVIAHRFTTVQAIADRIVVMDRGAIVEQGSHEELVRRGGWYAQWTEGVEETEALAA